jgi:hypothetical protein
MINGHVAGGAARHAREDGFGRILNDGEATSDSGVRHQFF